MNRLQSSVGTGATVQVPKVRLHVMVTCDAPINNMAAAESLGAHSPVRAGMPRGECGHLLRFAPAGLEIDEHHFVEVPPKVRLPSNTPHAWPDPQKLCHIAPTGNVQGKAEKSCLRAGTVPTARGSLLWRSVDSSFLLASQSGLPTL
jgi:hypothetical protein